MKIGRLALLELEPSEFQSRVIPALWVRLRLLFAYRSLGIALVRLEKGAVERYKADAAERARG